MSTIEQNILAALNGNQQAFKAIYAEYSKYVLTICRRYQVSSFEQKDYLQDIFSHCFLKLNKYDARKGDFQFWLRRLAINIIIQKKKKEKRNVLNYSTNLNEQGNEVTTIDLDYFSNEEIYMVLKNMPAKFSTVFNLFVIDGYSIKEIHDKIGMNEGTIRSNVSRGRKWAIDHLKKSSVSIHKIQSR